MLDNLIIWSSLRHTKCALIAMVQTLNHLTLSFKKKHGHFHFNDKKLNLTF